MVLKIAKKLPVLKKRPRRLEPTTELGRALRYIDDYWANLERFHPEDDGTIIGLPHPFIVPSFDPKASFNYEEQYYWDSYFTSLGLLDDVHQPLIEGMLENLLHLQKRFGMIPNASRMYMMSHSQPPILTSYIFDVYDRYDKSNDWLVSHIAHAEDEYDQIWMGNKHPMWHQVHRGLSRYYDINVLHDLAECESGWDMTTRFERKCLDYLPVDLNALLFKYEMDFARTAEILGDEARARHWESKAVMRKNTMNDLMWSKARGFYFDYNYSSKSRGGVWSLAGFFPMWAGMVDDDQAERLVNNLEKFEKDGGLTTTTRPLIDMSIFGSLKTQWAYPNGWAPLHFIVVEGLKRYGYIEQADRIQHKWLTTSLDWFTKHGVFLEKYNMVSPHKHPVEGVYPSQTGFGWTNAVFKVFADDLGLTE